MYQPYNNPPSSTNTPLYPYEGAVFVQGWDRTRRCDQQDYDPPCGPCEGVGGIPTGSENDEITLTTCQVSHVSHVTCDT